MFIKSNNNLNKCGNDQDKWVINSALKGEKYLKMYEFVGKLFGYIISSENYQYLNLSKFVYKGILNEKMDVKDIEDIDVHAGRILRSLMKLSNKNEKEENNNNNLNENNNIPSNKLFNILPFICTLSDGTQIELIPNGKNILLSHSNYNEYIKLYTNTRLNESYLQSNSILNGLISVIPKNILLILPWEDLENKIIGSSTFDINLLRQNTEYENYKESDKVIKFFWKFLESLNNNEKNLYIKFVWGRSKLPKDENGFKKDKHCITKMDCNEIEKDYLLPKSHTCFFTLDLPNYSTYEILEEKLMYAMKNGIVISDNDDEAIDIEL